MCSAEAMRPEQSGGSQKSGCSPQLQAAPWEPGMDGGGCPGDLEPRDLNANYARLPDRAAWHGECFSLAPLQRKSRKFRAFDALVNPRLKFGWWFQGLFNFFVLFPTSKKNFPLARKIGLIPVKGRDIFDATWRILNLCRWDATSGASAADGRLVTFTVTPDMSDWCTLSSPGSTLTPFCQLSIKQAPQWWTIQWGFSVCAFVLEKQTQVYFGKQKPFYWIETSPVCLFWQAGQRVRACVCGKAAESRTSGGLFGLDLSSKGRESERSFHFWRKCDIP